VSDPIAEWINGRTSYCHRVAARLAGEIIAAIAAGEELPDEWWQTDTYADIGEPESEVIAGLVREELEGTGITL